MSANIGLKKIHPFILISQFTDIGQDFKISKSILNQADAQSFFNICSDQLSILGLYGDREQCYIVAKVFLQADDMPNIEGEEVLVCLYSPQESRAAIIYLTSSSTYKEKPIKSSSSSILFVKYLFDLCPIVVACPSSIILNDWYFSEDPKLRNPFIEKDHIWGNVKISINKAPEPELKRLKLKRPDAALPHVYIPGDGTNSFYEYDISVPYTDNIVNEKDNLIQGAIQTNIRDLYHSPAKTRKFIKRLETKIAALSTPYSLKAEQAVQQIIQTFDDSRDMIDNIKQLHIEELFTSLKMMKFKEYFREWVRRQSFSDSLNALREEILKPRILEDATSERLFSKYLKNFMDEEDKKQQEQKIFINLNTCLQRIEEQIYNFLISELANKLKPIIRVGFQALENVYITACKLCEINIKPNPENDMLGFEISREDITLKTKIGYGQLKQIIHMGSFRYALFSSSGSTYISKFIANESSIEESEERSVIPDEDCFIAWGSVLHQCIIFQNTNKVAYYGSAAIIKQPDKGNSIPVYSDSNTIVRSAIYQTKKMKLIYIDQKGHLYSYDILADTQIVCPIKNEGSSDGDNSFLKPRTGSKFLEIQSTSNHNILFLRTEDAIEIYDTKFVYLSYIQLNSKFFAYKTIFENGLYYIIIFEEPKVRCYFYQAALASKSVANTPTARKEIPGNPIADVIHLSLSKFGDSKMIFNKKRMLYFSVTKNIYESNVVDYVNSLSSIHKSINFRGILKDSDIYMIINQPINIKAIEFKWALYTRVPLHIGCIVNGNLYPMHNGFNHYENIITSQDDSGTFLEKFQNERQFGHYEDILSDLKKLKVISIIGRQSSGKSYLLNRLFGTRFSVAAHRCTYGIWMSLAKLEGQYFVVFDCEGLFSLERTPQEEIKLCLFLSAISDLVILNQDLTFHRSLTELFEKLAHQIDRISGSKLFKGKLKIAIRDVGKGEGDETIQQIESFIQRVTDQGRDDFIHRLFRGRINFSLYHNFESQDLFNNDLKETRKEYLEELKSRWRSGKRLLKAMKTILIKIMTDDRI